jgi:hypothetical protein
MRALPGSRRLIDAAETAPYRTASNPEPMAIHSQLIKWASILIVPPEADQRKKALQYSTALGYGLERPASRRSRQRVNGGSFFFTATPLIFT